MKVIFVLVLADDFPPGAVLFEHSPQSAAEELLLPGGAAEKPVQ